MECIIKGFSTVLGILGKPPKSTAPMRLSKFILTQPTEEGVLLFSTLTRELLLLTPEEFEHAPELPYLQERWLSVPEGTNEKELVELVRWTRKTLRREPKHIEKYTILTTTDCNARCFYCYEKGCAKVSMTRETAQKVVAYIKAHCGGNEVKISWFGGEPLMNSEAIDWICQGLRKEGVAFKSQMVTNAYLFTDGIAEKSVNSWNVKNVQVTLDGTEAVYNRSKAYIHTQGSAYQVVLVNIRRMLDAGIAVAIRLNMDLHNADDLFTLAEELAEQFAGQKGLHVYAHLLFDTNKPWHVHHTSQEWEMLYDKLYKLEETLSARGMMSRKRKGLNREPMLNHCMADSGNSAVILPDGHLGLCEHFTDSEFFGHVDREDRDQAMIASWRESCDPVPECEDCVFVPECVTLKKCNGQIAYFPQSLQARRRETERAMLFEYRLWRKTQKG